MKWERVHSLFLTRLWEVRINLPEQISESSRYYVYSTFSPSYNSLALPTNDRRPERQYQGHRDPARNCSAGAPERKEQCLFAHLT